MMHSWTTKTGTVIYRVLSGRSNVYLIQYGKTCFLVDTGRRNRRNRLMKAIRMTGLLPRYLLLTHTHFDHAENATFLQRTSGLKVLVHPLEKSFLEKGTNTSLQIILPGPWQIMNRVIPKFIHWFHHEACIPDGMLEPGHLPADFPSGIRIMHTPGHSPGSVTVIIDNEVALTGDLMFGVFAISTIPPFGDDPRKMIESWEALIASGCSYFLPGHGSVKTLEQVKSSLVKLKRSLK